MAIELIKKLTEYSFDLAQIEKDVLNIVNEYNWPQIGLTHSGKFNLIQDQLLEGAGSALTDNPNELKFKETDFTIFNDAFKDTSLFEMYKVIPNIGRFRIMVMDGPKCYTIHRDITKRYHYVIETNPNCIFLFPGMQKQFHIPKDGNLYMVDTRYRHTFVNGSRKRRIHLVLDDLGTLVDTRK